VPWAIGQPVLRLETALAAIVGILVCSTSSVPRTADERRADEIITTRVKTALLAAPDVYAENFYVDGDRGAVRLSEYIFSAGASRAATRITMTVAGVWRDSNEIKIQDEYFFRGC